MAKVKLKSGDVLIVTEEEAQRISLLLQDKSLKEMSAPLAITHKDGMWMGSVNDTQQLYMDKGSEERIPFNTRKEMAEFHIKHGKHNERYHKGYGYLDMITLYRLKCELVELYDNGFYFELKDLKVSPEYYNECIGKWRMYAFNLNNIGMLNENITLDGEHYFPKSELRSSIGQRTE
ncbi:hypothetical protein EKK58_06155 [Candidatus Dependentiae bacterium]|nr:MAG: hypothetical protein EKK58_06155 [Candidatus Dependentiae bacterium]